MVSWPGHRVEFRVLLIYLHCICPLYVSMVSWPGHRVEFRVLLIYLQCICPLYVSMVSWPGHRIEFRVLLIYLHCICPLYVSIVSWPGHRVEFRVLLSYLHCICPLYVSIVAWPGHRVEFRVLLIYLHCVCFQGEIDAREDSFVSCAEAGERLVNSNHYAAEEVREKVGTVTALFSAWRFHAVVYLHNGNCVCVHVSLWILFWTIHEIKLAGKPRERNDKFPLLCFETSFFHFCPSILWIGRRTACDFMCDWDRFACMMLKGPF